MTHFAKAITAALILTLTPALASAQSSGAGFQILPGTSWNNADNPTAIGGGVGVGAPVQAQGCGAEYAQTLVGQNIAYIPIQSHARVIGPDTVVTFDFRPDRLNVAHDANGTITRVYCG